MEWVDDETLSLSDYESCFEEVEKEEQRLEKITYHATEEEDEHASLLNIVFSWSLEDALNEDLYKHKVQKIPETFRSTSEYLNSFISPLIEETHYDLCQNLKGVSRARSCEISTVERNKFFKLPKDLFYQITLKTTNSVLYDEMDDTGTYEPEPGDLFALADSKPERIDDLKRSGSYFYIAYVRGPKDENNDEFPILSSKSMGMDIESGFRSRKQRLYAVHLLNLTTNVRIWKALNSQLGGDEKNMNIIKEVLQVQQDLNVGGKCENCSSGVIDKFRPGIERCLLDRSQNLNESQKDAVSRCVNMIKCVHKDIKLIWGPPGTGKTNTLACLLFCFHKLKQRTLACAPTNTAVLQVADRLYSMVNGSLGYETYGLGDIVLMGNRSRMKLDSYPGLRDVFLDHRVENLGKCFAPMSGWKQNLDSLIQLLDDPKKQYSLYEKEQGHVSLEDFAIEKDNVSDCSMTFEDYLMKKWRNIVEEILSKKKE